MKSDIVAALRLLDRTVAYYPILGKVFGTSNAGLFVCQMLYWEGRQRDPERWIMKTTTEIENEIGLSRHELDNVKRKLVGMGVCEFQLMGSPPSGAWRFNWERVNELVYDFACVDEERRVKIPPMLTPNQYEKRLSDLAGSLKELEKRNQQLQKQYDDLVKKQTPEDKAEKAKPLPTQMAELFDRYFQAYNPDAGKYKFMDKDFGQLKNLEKVLRDRNLEQKKAHAKHKNLPTEGMVSTDSDVMEAWDYMLTNLPEWYRVNNMSPAALYSNLMTIIQQIKNDAKKLSNDTKPNKENTPVNPFAAAVRRTGEQSQ